LVKVRLVSSSVIDILTKLCSIIWMSPYWLVKMSSEVAFPCKLFRVPKIFAILSLFRCFYFFWFCGCSRLVISTDSDFAPSWTRFRRPEISFSPSARIQRFIIIFRSLTVSIDVGMKTLHFIDIIST
jgi:hypothetical protein